MHLRIQLIVLTIAVFAGSIAAATRQPVKKPTAADTKQRIEQLRKIVVAGGDESEAAFEELVALKPPRPVLAEVLAQSLRRDATTVEAKCRAMPGSEKIAEMEKQLAQLRQEARANIDKLTKEDDSVSKADQIREKLTQVYKAYLPALQARETIAAAMARRPARMKKYRSVLQRGGPLFIEKNEAKLKEQAEKALGMSIQDAASIPAPGTADDADEQAPEHPAKREIWLYRIARAIESHNKQAAENVMSEEELLNVRHMNDYRVLLGELPLEIDPRLVQSARRHSKEMVEMGYFAHESPVAQNKTPGDRISKAGFPHRGAGENIAYGPDSGEGAFEAWFHSPGHHQNMARQSYDLIGVGRWNNHWTQNFARGSRQVFQPEKDRKTPDVMGDILKAQ